MAQEMYINEIATGTDVKITAYIGTEKLELSTVTVWSDDKQLAAFRAKNCCVAVKPISLDGKIITLSQAAGIVYFLHAYLKKEELLYEWKNVIPFMANLKSGERYLLLICEEKGKPVNRREHFRIWLGIEGTLRVGVSQSTMPVIIKDLSARGMGLVVQKEKDPIKNGSLVHVHFYDEDMEMDYKIGGIVVRREEIDEHRMLLGCRFSTEHDSISSYIQRKERLNLRKRSGKFSEPTNSKLKKK